MASGGRDADRTEQIMRDIEMENAETFQYNIDVQNGYESRSGWGNDGFEIVDRGPKRKRISTGSTSSVSTERFQNLGTDAKLAVMFELLCNVQTMQSRSSMEIKGLTWNISGACEKVDKVEKRVDLHARKLRMLSYKSIDLESRSRRNNLIFWGLTENNNRPCDQLILNFMAHEMRIDTADMVIDRVHRLGAYQRLQSMGRYDRRRPMIVRFRDYRDVDHVMDNAYKLRGSSFRVDRDYPKEIVEARSRLNKCEEAQDARRKGSKIQIKYPAKLFINNRLIRDEFPYWHELMRESRTDGFEIEEGGDGLTDSGANVGAQRQSDSSYRGMNVQPAESSAAIENNENNASNKNISFSIESVLMPKHTVQAPNKEQGPPGKHCSLNVHELTNQTMQNSNNLLIDFSTTSVTASGATAQPTSHGNESINPHSSETQNVIHSQNPPQDRNTATYISSHKDLYTLYRPKSIERGGARVSSVDSGLAYNTEAHSRRSRSRVRNPINDTNVDRNKQSASQSRKTLLAPPKFNVDGAGTKHALPLSGDNDVGALQGGQAIVNQDAGQKTDTNMSHSDSDGRERPDSNVGAGNDPHQSNTAQ